MSWTDARDHGSFRYPDPRTIVDQNKAKNEITAAAREHSCPMKIGHPTVTGPCRLCKAIEAYDKLMRKYKQRMAELKRE